MANPPSDQGIPLLTEVIGPQSQADTANPAASAQARQDTPAPLPPAAKISQPLKPSVPPPAAARTATGQPGSDAMPQISAPLPPVSSSAGQSGWSPNSAASAAPAPASSLAANAATHLAAPAMQPATQVAPPIAAPAPAPAQDPADLEIETSSAPALGTWNDSELRDLENELRLRITRQVLGRIDFVLDHRVRNSVTEVVDAAIDALATEIKRGLHETLTDMVARAVAQEVSRLQSGKK